MTRKKVARVLAVLLAGAILFTAASSGVYAVGERVIPFASPIIRQHRPLSICAMKMEC